MKKIALHGSTGSIGTSTLHVLENLKEEFQIVSLSAGQNSELLCRQAEKIRPDRVYIESDCKTVYSRLNPLGIEVLHGPGHLDHLASDSDVDLVINGLAAGVGLRPTLSAIRAGKDVAIANKETLVVAGHIVTELAKKHQVRLLPIDSEMTPLWQTLQDLDKASVKRIFLPASGGPFFDYSERQMSGVTPKEALKHPTWKMGPKITIDSATLMNKGFEVIESQWFLGLSTEQVEVIIHRESIVHCLIEFTDGSVTAHMSNPDMRLPIHQALIHPRILPSQVRPLDLTKTGGLTFFLPDLERFPCLGLAYLAQKTGGTAPAVLNAANEVAVYAFLEGQIGFTDIPRVVHETLDAHTTQSGTELEVVFEADEWGRTRARSLTTRIAAS